MAKLIVPGGPLGFERPILPMKQSRIVALELSVLAGVGNTDYCYTPTLGNRTVLRGIDVWAYSGSPSAWIGGFFYLMFGTGVPVAAGDVAVRWVPIIPLHCGMKPGFAWMESETIQRHFTMDKLFVHDELRFGVVIDNGYDKAWNCTVAFEFSEG